MEHSPVILIIGLRNSKSANLVKLIFDHDVFDSKPEDNASSHFWLISNKYYSAKVQFHIVNFPDVIPSYLTDRIEAVILFIDCVLEDFMPELKVLNNYLEHAKPAIQTFVCSKKIPEEIVSSVEDWCIHNRFELVELESPPFFGNSVSTFNEYFGVDRVMEILHAHHWPNLVLKERKSFSALSCSSDLRNPKSIENEEKPSKDPSHNDFSPKESLDDMDNLSTLFKDLKTLKQEISSLTGDEKMKQAEKVVKMFWLAMRGDSDEFSQSEDDS